MRLTLVALLSLALAGYAEAGSFKPANRDTSVRPLSAHAEKLIGEGMAGSATFRRMVNRIEASDVIVYVESRPDLRASVGGLMRFVTRSASHRFLLIQVNIAQVRPVQIAMLGHELRHVVEVVEQPEIRTSDDLHRYYRQQGVRTGLGTLDSVAAQQAGYVVREELHASRGVRYARVTPEERRALTGASIHGGDSTSF